MQKGIIVVNGKWGYPKGGVVYRIGRYDSIKGLLCALCVFAVKDLNYEPRRTRRDNFEF